MSLFPKSANRLIDQLSKLPGIGRITAQRLAFYILKSDEEYNINLSQRRIQSVINFISIYQNAMFVKYLKYVYEI